MCCALSESYNSRDLTYSVRRFIGACARKQLFVTIFATFLYIHFFLNLGVAAYFLFMITHAANTDIVKACKEGIQNSQAQDQCTDLLDFVKTLFWVFSILVLAVEACAYSTPLFFCMRNEWRYLTSCH
jgi:hypothetical protein